MERKADRARPGKDGRESPKDRQGRRRGAALERAIMAAVWDELVAVGYANLTMEGVAARAGTSRAVLYRRWPSRALLVLAAARQRIMLATPESMNAPDTGTLRGDVLALLHRILRRYSEFGVAVARDVVHGLMADRHDLPPELFQETPTTMMTILRRATERGEIRLDKVSPRIAALPVILLIFDLLVRDNPVTEATITEIVDEIFLPLLRQ